MSRQWLTYVLPIVAVAYVVSLFSIVQPASAYVTAQRWETNYTEYMAASNMNTSPFPSSTYSDISAAATKWSQGNTGKNFNIYQPPMGPTRVYVTRASFSAQGWPSNPAQTNHYIPDGYLRSSTIYLNSDWSWNTSCDLSQSGHRADLPTIIVHEMGHLVRLLHDSNHTEAVMWPDYTCKRQLATDDKNGVGARYP